MIENFFQSLSSRKVEYLLISGQATVLYGAATFSEDIDLWVNPTAANLERFMEVMRSSAARYYKLTPPLKPALLARGHGFHFVLPEPGGLDVYLDVMGVPPRVPSFVEAMRGAQWIESDWGRVHVVGIQELVELKKTQRLEDYPIIGRLALAWLEQSGRPLSCDDFHWALDHIFTLPELQLLFERHPAATGALRESDPVCMRDYAARWRGGPSERLEAEVALFLQGRIAALQHADRNYWRRIIQDLKQLRTKGKLMPEGREV